MQSLKNITLDYLSKNLSEDLLDELGKKVLNKYYTGNDEVVEVIWEIDDDAIYTETGDHLIYWLWKYVPRYANYIYEDDFYDLDGFHDALDEIIEKKGKNETIYIAGGFIGCPRLWISDQQIMVHSINFKVDKIPKLTKKLLEKLPANVSKHITTKQFPSHFLVESGGRIYPIEPLSIRPYSLKNNAPVSITEWYGLLE